VDAFDVTPGATATKPELAGEVVPLAVPVPAGEVGEVGDVAEVCPAGVDAPAELLVAGGWLELFLPDIETSS
jgi:hypothetical protein